jgi:hypothetical protein
MLMVMEDFAGEERAQKRHVLRFPRSKWIDGAPLGGVQFPSRLEMSEGMARFIHLAASAGSGRRHQLRFCTDHLPEPGIYLANHWSRPDAIKITAQQRDTRTTTG